MSFHYKYSEGLRASAVIWNVIVNSQLCLLVLLQQYPSAAMQAYSTYDISALKNKNIRKFGWMQKYLIYGMELPRVFLMHDQLTHKLTHADIISKVSSFQAAR